MLLDDIRTSGILKVFVTNLRNPLTVLSLLLMHIFILRNVLSAIYFISVQC